MTHYKILLILFIGIYSIHANGQFYPGGNDYLFWKNNYPGFKISPHSNLALRYTLETNQKQKVSEAFQLDIQIPLFSKNKIYINGGINSITRSIGFEPVSQFRINPSIQFVVRSKGLDLLALGALSYNKTQFDPTRITTGMQWDHTAGFLPSAPTGEIDIPEENGVIHPSFGLVIAEKKHTINFSYLHSRGHFFQLQKNQEFNSYSIQPRIGFHYFQKAGFSTGINVAFKKIFTLDLNGYTPWAGIKIDNMLNTGVYSGVFKDNFQAGITLAKLGKNRGLSQSLFLIIPLKHRKKEKTNLSRLQNEVIKPTETPELPTYSKPATLPGIHPTTSYSLALNFKLNEWKLTKEAEKELIHVVNMLESDPELKLVVIGHSDQSGDMDTKQTISDKRAQSVAGFLSSKGISNDRISAYGVSDSQPFTSGEDETSRFLNRRIDFIFYK
ncbi:MAG: OmpA family protein [Cyclobacteriaceae bacterium]|nr:OmpA family protein [Cyclobacteriaceae bacterium]